MAEQRFVAGIVFQAVVQHPEQSIVKPFRSARIVLREKTFPPFTVHDQFAPSRRFLSPVVDRIVTFIGTQLASQLRGQ